MNRWFYSHLLDGLLSPVFCEEFTKQKSVFSHERGKVVGLIIHSRASEVLRKNKI